MKKLLLTSIVLASCGQEPATTGDKEVESATEKQVEQEKPITGSFAVAESSDLPECGELLRNVLYYVTETESFSVCKESGWAEIDIKGKDGADGTDGADGQDGTDGVDGDSRTITALWDCNGLTADLDAGADLVKHYNTRVVDFSDGSTEISCNGYLIMSDGDTSYLSANEYLTAEDAAKDLIPTCNRPHLYSTFDREGEQVLVGKSYDSIFTDNVFEFVSCTKRN